ncbi:MAG: hypothetical protein GWP08_20220 [Nitrospiraceae bacterium]|nr:hypothetical protein [Nitrospiraceae bacterium]
MASCTQVETMLQAWIDEELGHAERVILEQHLAECTSCRSIARKQQRSTALLFETFGEHRLRHDLRRHIQNHLPEMAPSRITMKSNSSRAKVPLLAPALAAAVVLMLAGVLYVQWPEEPSPGGALGVVTYSEGGPTHRARESAEATTASLKTYVKAGERYETGPDARLMLTLRGPTRVKIAENTSLRIVDDREVQLEAGRIWLHVSPSERRFRVDTPIGEVDVLGTTLDVEVEGEQTVVTVRKGTVRVENGRATVEVARDEQVVLKNDEAELTPRTVIASQEMRWADAILPEPEATRLFEEVVQAPETGLLRKEQFFVFSNPGRKAVSSFEMTWDPGAQKEGHCSYDVHVYDGNMSELFTSHVDGSVFESAGKTSYVLWVPEGPITGVNMIQLKVVPDYSTGEIETSLDVAAPVQ